MLILFKIHNVQSKLSKPWNLHPITERNVYKKMKTNFAYTLF